jgi:NAD(P)-dependent dehydrogenase (short-subunit alcohol dehydrogenase family)
MAVNLRAPFIWAREECEATIAAGRGGRIVNMASQAAVVALDGHPASCASKAGLLGMGRVLALEWGPHGITSNAVLPTVVETGLGRKVWAGGVGEAFKRKIPARRFARPEEIALAVHDRVRPCPRPLRRLTRGTRTYGPGPSSSSSTRPPDTTKCAPSSSCGRNSRQSSPALPAGNNVRR